MKDYLLIGMLGLLSGSAWGQCVTGNPGTNCSGPLNVQPQSGNTNQSAITLVDLGLPVPSPVPGQYTLSIASGMLLESDNGNSYHSLVGPQGVQGATGLAGPTGAQGAQGVPGAAGAIGPAGPTGAQGATGLAGPTGAQGAQGIPGAAGAIGPAGPSGAQGATGLAGPTGAQGAQGVPGAAGAIGPAGPQGAPGVQGAIGPAGPTGAQGIQGPAGSLAAPPDYSFYDGATGFSAVVGTSEIGATFDRDQINMLSAVSVRFVATIATNVLASGSYAQAEYTADGTDWYALSGEVPVTAGNGTYTSGWQGMPTGANGDFMVRIIVFNAGKKSANVALRQLHLQFQ
jgi:Collagen triple helix repeat (20 copies)